MILATVHGVGPSNDAPHLSTLKRRASRSDERGQPAWVTLADSGFDSAKIGPRDIIPPIRRGGDLKATQRSRVGIASSFRWPVWSALEGRDCSLCHQTQIR